MLEPNTFVLDDLEELESELRGHIAETEVVFLKTYRTSVHEPVYFEGEMTDQGRKIIGRWYYGWPDEISGRFEMTRKSLDKPAD